MSAVFLERLFDVALLDRVLSSSLAFFRFLGVTGAAVALIPPAWTLVDIVPKTSSIRTALRGRLDWRKDRSGVDARRQLLGFGQDGKECMLEATGGASAVHCAHELILLHGQGGGATGREHGSHDISAVHLAWVVVVISGSLGYDG